MSSNSSDAIFLLAGVGRNDGDLRFAQRLPLRNNIVFVQGGFDPDIPRGRAPHGRGVFQDQNFFEQKRRGFLLAGVGQNESDLRFVPRLPTESHGTTLYFEA